MITPNIHPCATGYVHLFVLPLTLALSDLDFDPNDPSIKTQAAIHNNIISVKKCLKNWAGTPTSRPRHFMMQEREDEDYPETDESA